MNYSVFQYLVYLSACEALCCFTIICYLAYSSDFSDLLEEEMSDRSCKMLTEFQKT